MTMTRQKDLKRLVRARMRKTGEAYTAARVHIIRKPKTTTRVSQIPIVPDSLPDPREYAALAGMSDASLNQKTGRTWEEWVRELDGHDARRMSHRDIAALVSAKYKIDGWWSQTVTVGFERIKGLRARGQRRDGTYEANKSRTFDVPVTTLFEAWADARVRRRWLGDAEVNVRTATKAKSMRLGWPDRSIIAVGFTAKGRSKSSVALSHSKLPDRPTADRLKQYWSERLDALGNVLTTR
jgi:hypothetical protein